MGIDALWLNDLIDVLLDVLRRAEKENDQAYAERVLRLLNKAYWIRQEIRKGYPA